MRPIVTESKSRVRWRLARLAELPRDLRAVMAARRPGVDYLPYLLGKFGSSLLPGATRLPTDFPIHDDGHALRVALGPALTLQCPKSLTERIDLLVMLGEVISENVYRCDVIKHGACVFDCGANIGVFCCYAAALAGPKGRVYAWEPVAEACDVVLRNVQANDQEQVVCIRKGLADWHGRATIHVPLSHSNCSSLESGAEGRPEEIEVTTLDAEVERLGVRQVDLIKIDVEGYEEQLLRGAAETLRAFRPALAMAAYHHEEDLWRLPAVIRAIEPAYRVTVFYSWVSAFIFASCGTS